MSLPVDVLSSSRMKNVSARKARAQAAKGLGLTPSAPRKMNKKLSVR